ncbi:MAG: CDP-alcohol phosphatidyltransferase family protein [Nocardioides sp.]|nr:CDP-alcohol phosphatidyltransferase family protein [Nocardioides sp.]
MKVLGIQRPGPADLMTIGNAACGAVAVLVVVAYGTRPAADLSTSGIRAVTILLLVGTIFDTLDGAFARGGRGTPLGPMLDSLADALSFGVAPAMLLASIGMRGASTPEQVAVGLGMVAYVAAALLRLADFSSTRHEDAAFTGLPSPLAAGLAVAIAFLSDSPYVIAVGLGLVGYMMVSRLGYPKQRGPVLGAALLAWTFGIAGSLGLYDVRIGAVVIIVVIGVLLPVLPAIISRDRQPAL